MIDGLTPWMSDKLSELLRFAARNNISVRIVSTRRSCAEQDAIYESGAGTATQVSGCRSWHVWGRAADLEIAGPFAEYAVLGAEWKRMGGVWGGDFGFTNDAGHFEWHPEFKISDLCASAADCPDPSLGWPEDRPFLARPLVQGSIGLVLAGGGLVLATRMLKR